MRFRTELPPVPQPVQLSLSDSVVTMGSCFADEMGLKLRESKINTLVNPFGTVYNPLSLTTIITQCLSDTPFPLSLFTERQQVFFHHYVHSRFHAASAEALGTLLSEKQKEVKEALKEAHWLIITWGTSVIYEYQGTVVANCHKQPSQRFQRRLLSVQEIESDFNKLYTALKTANKNLKILITVSPVRHIKDTLPVNSVSKSILRLAADLCEKTHDDVYYYPAYEILLDDLRDYRFYSEDLIHPSAAAVGYIWEHFKTCFFTKDHLEILKKWDKTKMSLRHRPLTAISDEYFTFLHSLKEKLIELSAYLPLNDEIAEVEATLKQWKP